MVKEDIHKYLDLIQQYFPGVRPREFLDATMEFTTAKYEGKDTYVAAIYPGEGMRPLYIPMRKMLERHMHQDLLTAVYRTLNDFFEIMKKCDLKIRENGMPTFAELRDKIYVAVCPENAKELLEHIPHIDIEEFSLVFKIRTENGTGLVDAPAITYEMLDYWIKDGQLQLNGSTKDRAIFDAIIDNAQEMLPLAYNTMASLISNMSPEENLSGIGITNDVYIITNKYKIDGLGALFYPDSLNRLGEQLGSFFILPTSIHECIVVMDKSQMLDEDDLNDKLDSILADLQGSLPDSQKISYSTYHYDAVSGRLEKAKDYLAKPLLQRVSFMDLPDFDDTDKKYISATNRDYGPSNPWDAPGMSIRDFI